MNPSLTSYSGQSCIAHELNRPFTSSHIMLNYTSVSLTNLVQLRRSSIKRDREHNSSVWQIIQVVLDQFARLYVIGGPNNCVISSLTNLKFLYTYSYSISLNKNIIIRTACLRELYQFLKTCETGVSIAQWSVLYPPQIDGETLKELKYYYYIKVLFLCLTIIYVTKFRPDTTVTNCTVSKINNTALFKIHNLYMNIFLELMN